MVLETPSLAEYLLATRSPEDRRLDRAPRERLFAREADDYRERLRQEKKDLAARVTGRGIPVRNQTETVLNTLLVEANEEELEWLRRQPGVESATFDHEFKPLLDAALPLVGAPQVWASLGGENNAGRGVKIGIIDSGIDQTHPMLDGSGLTPAGSPFPLGETRFTNNKVIVARNFTSESDPADRLGHGTFVAAAAAGRRAQSPLVSLAGVAPAAFLGSYKVFGATGSPGDVIKAIDRAVQDGMDIINLSLGEPISSPPPPNDPYFLAIRNATGLGVVVVAAASNDGPTPRTISIPGILADVITVGASTNSRTYTPTVRVTAPAPVPGALERMSALAGSVPALTSPVGPAVIVDVTQLDPSGLACSALPAGSLSGRIVLIRRGICFFRDKVKNAAQGGAAGVVIYNHVSGTVRMDTAGAPIPSVSLTNADGLALLAFLRNNPGTVQVLIDSQLTSFPETADLVTGFSGRGPNTDFSIKPDLVAPGNDILSATQSLDPSGDLFNPDRYTTADGTSFSTPIVSGAAALLRQKFGSGFAPANIKSALVNTATPLAKTLDGALISVMNAGAGKLNLPAALSATLVARPVSLSFGASSPRVALNSTQQVTLTNVGTTTAAYTASIAPRYSDPNLKVAVDPSTFTLAAGASATLNVSVSNTSMLQSSYEGFINIRNQAANTAINVPYWVSFAVPEVNAGGVVNAASYAARVSPGAIVSLFGLALSGPPAGAIALPLLTTLGGSSLRVNRTDVPLFFSSTGQINAQLPFSLATGTASGTMRRDGITGPAFSFQITDFSPGIFTVRQDGAGPGAILHASSGVLVDPQNPARAGEFVSVFCTGLGQVTTPPDAGTAAGDTPLSTTLTQPTVTMDNLPAVVQFSGLAPGFVSLYQVNAQVPTGLGTGEHRLVISIGGVDSNPVTITLR